MTPKKGAAMIKDLRCPHCGRLNQAHDSATGEKQDPDDGDLAICWTCIAPSFFVKDPETGDITLREPTTDEYILLNKDPRVGALIQDRKVTYTPGQTIRRARRRTDGEQK
jgi:hypothetical protein